jgi:hypothetical protein
MQLPRQSIKPPDMILFAADAAVAQVPGRVDPDHHRPETGELVHILANQHCLANPAHAHHPHGHPPSGVT